MVRRVGNGKNSHRYIVEKNEGWNNQNIFFIWKKICDQCDGIQWQREWKNGGFQQLSSCCDRRKKRIDKKPFELNKFGVALASGLVWHLKYNTKNAFVATIKNDTKSFAKSIERHNRFAFGQFIHRSTVSKQKKSAFALLPTPWVQHLTTMHIYIRLPKGKTTSNEKKKWIQIKRATAAGDEKWLSWKLYRQIGNILRCLDTVLWHTQMKKKSW